jgi:hypothetical protein
MILIMFDLALSFACFWIIGCAVKMLLNWVDDRDVARIRKRRAIELAARSR